METMKYQLIREGEKQRKKTLQLARFVWYSCEFFDRSGLADAVAPGVSQKKLNKRTQYVSTFIYSFRQAAHWHLLTTKQEEKQFGTRRFGDDGQKFYLSFRANHIFVFAAGMFPSRSNNKPPKLDCMWLLTKQGDTQRTKALA